MPEASTFSQIWTCLLQRIVTRENLNLFGQDVFFPYGKVNVKVMLTGVLICYKCFLCGKRFMQYRWGGGGGLCGKLINWSENNTCEPTYCRNKMFDEKTMKEAGLLNKFDVR